MLWLAQQGQLGQGGKIKVYASGLGSGKGVKFFFK